MQSGLDIARSLYSYLYLCAPPLCPETGRTRTIEQINDILQGRNKKCNAEKLLAEIDEICADWPDYAEERPILHERIQSFLRQKELLAKERPQRRARQPPKKRKRNTR